MGLVFKELFSYRFVDSTENALAHQACVLRADLEKSLQDNALLFSKIGKHSFTGIESFEFVRLRTCCSNLMLLDVYLVDREDKLNADNKSVVNNFLTELARQVASLRIVVDGSLSQQNEHLDRVEKFCQSFQQAHERVGNFFFIASSVRQSSLPKIVVSIYGARLVMNLSFFLLKVFCFLQKFFL